MGELPFTMTSEAAEYIERILLDFQRYPERLSLTTVFWFSSSMSWVDRMGKGGGYSYPQAHLGRNRHEDLDAADYLELDLVGFKVLCHKRTVEFLTGKRIELKEISEHTILAIIDDNAPKWT